VLRYTTEEWQSFASDIKVDEFDDLGVKRNHRRLAPSSSSNKLQRLLTSPTEMLRAEIPRINQLASGPASRLSSALSQSARGSSKPTAATNSKQHPDGLLRDTNACLAAARFWHARRQGASGPKGRSGLAAPCTVAGGHPRNYPDLGRLKLPDAAELRIRSDYVAFGRPLANGIRRPVENPLLCLSLFAGSLNDRACSPRDRRPS
jgi:hypothetical protein